MTDFLHLDNLIQGAVLQITERRPLDEQLDGLEALHGFLGAQLVRVTLAKLKVQEKIDRQLDLFQKDQDKATESAVEKDHG